MKNNSQFKTMRHIETVRNFLNAVVKELLNRQEKHDQTKMQEPEISTFEKYTPKLRDCTYDSDEYKRNLVEMKPGVDHHNEHNRHHPEHFRTGVNEMNLIDLIEMLCDWKAAGMRHNDGDLFKSIAINKTRFEISDQLESILVSTAIWLTNLDIYNHSEES